MPKVKVKRAVKLKAYAIIDEAVARGVGFGWNRAHKYVDNPTEATIKEKMQDEVMLALTEILEFGEE